MNLAIWQLKLQLVASKLKFLLPWQLSCIDLIKLYKRKENRQYFSSNNQLAVRLLRFKVMSRNYDNWGKLVAATLDREKLHELALADSVETSCCTSISADFSSRFNFKFTHLNSNEEFPASFYDMWFRSVADRTDKVITATDAASSFRQECEDLKRKTQQLKSRLELADRVRDTLFDRPLNRIVIDAEKVLRRAARLILRCSGFRRVFSNIDAASFGSMSAELEHCIMNLSWLLRGDNSFFGSPPIAVDEPTLCYIWELVTVITIGSANDQLEAAASVISLAGHDDHCHNLIIKEGGAKALLGLLYVGNPQGQEYAARAIGLLGKDHKSACKIMSDETCIIILCRVVKDSTVNVQVAIMWAVAELADHGGNFCREMFAKHNFIELLIDHLPQYATRVTVMAARAVWHLAKQYEGFQQRLGYFLESQVKQERKEACIAFDASTRNNVYYKYLRLHNMC